MRRICPEAFDLTSTMSIGSTVPVASIVTRDVAPRDRLDGRHSDGAAALRSRNAATTASSSATIARGARSRPSELGSQDSPSGTATMPTRFTSCHRLLPDERLELRLGDALVVARRIRSRRAWSSVVCEVSTSSSVGRADGVALLLHAQVLLGGLDGRGLRGDALVRGMERSPATASGPRSAASRASRRAASAFSTRDLRLRHLLTRAGSG